MPKGEKTFFKMVRFFTFSIITGKEEKITFILFSLLPEGRIFFFIEFHWCISIYDTAEAETLQMSVIVCIAVGNIMLLISVTGLNEWIK